MLNSSFVPSVHGHHHRVGPLSRCRIQTELFPTRKQERAVFLQTIMPRFQVTLMALVTDQVRLAAHLPHPILGVRIPAENLASPDNKDVTLIRPLVKQPDLAQFFNLFLIFFKPLFQGKGRVQDPAVVRPKGRAWLDALGWRFARGFFLRREEFFDHGSDLGAEVGAVEPALKEGVASVVHEVPDAVPFVWGALAFDHETNCAGVALRTVRNAAGQEENFAFFDGDVAEDAAFLHFQAHVASDHVEEFFPCKFETQSCTGTKPCEQCIDWLIDWACNVSFETATEQPRNSHGTATWLKHGMPWWWNWMEKARGQYLLPGGSLSVDWVRRRTWQRAVRPGRAWVCCRRAAWRRPCCVPATWGCGWRRACHHPRPCYRPLSRYQLIPSIKRTKSKSMQGPRSITLDKLHQVCNGRRRMAMEHTCDAVFGAESLFQWEKQNYSAVSCWFCRQLLLLPSSRPQASQKRSMVTDPAWKCPWGWTECRSCEGGKFDCTFEVLPFTDSTHIAHQTAHEFWWSRSSSLIDPRDWN